MALGGAAPDLTYALASRITAGGLHARPFLRGGNPCTSLITTAAQAQLQLLLGRKQPVCSLFKKGTVASPFLF